VVIPVRFLAVENLKASEPVFKRSGHQRDIDKDPFEFVLSNETVDRTGDVIRAKGWMLDHFKQNPIALFAHKHDQPIGVWQNVRVEGKALLGQLKLAAQGTSPLVDSVRAFIQQGILKTVSVGFMPLEGQPRVKDKPYEGYEYTKAALHEVSVVAVPCNPDASVRKAVEGLVSKEIADIVFPEWAESDGELGEIIGKSALEIQTPNLDRMRERFRKYDIY
jgi:HK97 family phage prohead protease